jgi:HSP20 family protein
MEGKKKKRKGFFDFFGGNDEFFDSMDDFFSRLHEEMEDDMERMRNMRLHLDDAEIQRLSEDPNVKVYGYSLRVGPDGKPHFREFGNVRPPKPLLSEEIREAAEQGPGGREPLVDVFNCDGKTIVVAELPGVSENDIKISLSGRSLEIEAGAGERRYYKKLKLPKAFKKSSMKKKYNNGVLELTFS